MYGKDFRDLVERQDVRLALVDGADHNLTCHEKALEEILAADLMRRIGAVAATLGMAARTESA
jgi:predicted GTPase